ncbi:uncharacterized protein LOC133804610 [Humulus lupulus]|uniref:uncharacterized protein LOC133804610 n=1 Tax=Humulus lupulus TaxID=3486 RepID=UPI002B401654|nr:uncharacterized protein LOC133804610 [Humulus lupulus]
MLASVSAAATSISSWLRSRRIRYLFLLLCSPVLLPFLCATFPFLCAAELCLRICRRRSRNRRKIADELEEDDRLRRCEEGCCGGHGPDEGGGVGLLQRYLEDQLLLVGSMYDCGDDGEIADGFDSDFFSHPGIGDGFAASLLN